jgi:hypothetical protein
MLCKAFTAFRAFSMLNALQSHNFSLNVPFPRAPECFAEHSAHSKALVETIQYVQKNVFKWITDLRTNWRNNKLNLCSSHSKHSAHPEDDQSIIQHAE